MAAVIGSVNGKLSGFVRSALPSIKLSLRTLTTLQRESGDLTLTPTSPLSYISEIKTDKNLVRKHERRTNSLLDTNIINNCFGNLLQIETIQFSSFYYSNRTHEKLQSCNDYVIDYKVKPLSDISFELPNRFKYSNIIEEPINNKSRNEIFYINPTPGLKIISDPLLPKMAPIEDAPNGTVKIEKQAKRQHRMLKIRKKKMKVHRRKRLWKRM